MLTTDVKCPWQGQHHCENKKEKGAKKRPKSPKVPTSEVGNQPDEQESGWMTKVTKRKRERRNPHGNTDTNPAYKIRWNRITRLITVQLDLWSKKRQASVFISLKRLDFHDKIDHQTTEASSLNTTRAMMKNKGENFIPLAINIGLAVATFLLNTGFVLQAIQLCKECSILLNNGDLCNESPVNKFNLFHQRILNLENLTWSKVFHSKTFEAYVRKLLLLNQDSNKNFLKGHLNLILADILQVKNNLVEAAKFYEVAKNIMKVIGDAEGEATCYGKLGTLFQSLSQYNKAREYQEKALVIRKNFGDRNGEAVSCEKLGELFHFLGQYGKAREHLERALAIRIQIKDRDGEAKSYRNLGTLFHSAGQYGKAREYLKKALSIKTEIGDKNGEAAIYGNLGTLCHSLGQYDKSREYLKKALAINLEIGDRNGEAVSYGNLGKLFGSFGQCDKAREYLEKALAIKKEIGDGNGEAAIYAMLGTLSHSLSQYDKAQEYLDKTLAIKKEIGDKNGEAAVYRNLGTLFQSLAQYDKAQKYEEKGLAIKKEIGDKNGEAASYGNLGTLFQSLGQYDKARDYLEKALTINKEIGYRNGEAANYRNLGKLFQSLGQYSRAQGYLEKALAITIEIGDKDGEATNYGILGSLFKSIGQYDKAPEYLEKALAIKKEIGVRNGEAINYRGVGVFFLWLGQYNKAQKYLGEALAITIEIGDRAGAATNYGCLGTFFQSLGQYDKAREYLEKALAIEKDIGDRSGAVRSYGDLTCLHLCVGQYRMAEKYLERAMEIRMKVDDRGGEANDLTYLGIIAQKRGLYDEAQKYHKRALKISMENGDRQGELVSYGNLGSCFRSLGKYVMAEEYFEKALRLSRDIRHILNEFQYLYQLAKLKVSEDDREAAFSYLFQSIIKFDTIRGSLEDNDELKISLLEEHGTQPYKILSHLLSSTAKPEDALYVEELRRARALADLMATQYSIKEQITGNPQTWCSIQNVIPSEGDCACLYISVGEESVRFWVLKATRAILFLERQVSLDPDKATGVVRSLNEFLSGSFRSLGILPEEKCEDRTFDDRESMQLVHENCALFRDDDAAKVIQTDLPLCHKIIISPVADLLKEPEIIIVPDSCMYQVPFSALREEGGKYFSEMARIRIVPSLTTLKIIQESPPEYHSHTGALIIGDPEVGEVIYNARRRTIAPLPCARNEAVMIGRLLGVTPLTGGHATKVAVLQAIDSVSLIHLAAHGDAERGEILLSPERPMPFITREEAYLLTMADISKIKLRAKLVVLSCCHSARGQIRAEGVIGIARAFIGSGARSVLAARWALDDTATEQFMNYFYRHLFLGKSASECLHEARKWMRNNGFEEISKWASFMVIGDNVSFDFGKWPKSTTSKEP
ncbi:Tetratricopeptide repeat protein 28 [Stylophora pistillata]|uniref:Tetratricopeptide repeat protein 28 n=1 Tax=Stylophora pistillata TaxID=50429 RepID=A0A2B4S322_STYPI|nr:Tetratricopeptide repeat protein 28 [Stylophora pistillata]